ncbi:AAA family ATPase [Paenibacillus sp.]|uniref:AAA family ATPase n=1 Tax=Paenibacillus sp. TaxID=58172 RepID=UPI003464559B
MDRGSDDAGSRMAPARGEAFMKILRIHLIGYGGFRDTVIPLAERGSGAGITLLHGPNEAGKSTITSFIRDMLYGFPKRRSNPSRFMPSEGSMYGGRMNVLDRSGAEWSIERWEQEGVSHTSIRKMTEAGIVTEADQTQLENELLGGLSSGLYSRLFGITLDELQELQTLQDDEVGAYLYDAGLYGGRGITEAERWLQQSMDGLYRPRGRNQHINQTLHAMDKLERGQREAHRHAAKLGELAEQVTLVRLELNRCVEKRTRLRAELATAERASGVADTWIRYVAAKQELEAQPADLIARLPELATQWKECERKLSDIEAACRGIEDKRKAAVANLLGQEPFSQLLEMEAETRRLVQLTDTVQHWREAAGEAELEYSAAEAELWRLARQTDASWTPERLLSSNAFSYTEQVQAAELRAEACRLAVAQSEAGMERSAREAESALQEYEDAKKLLERYETDGVNGSGFAPSEECTTDIAHTEQALADAVRVWNASTDGGLHVLTGERAQPQMTSYSRMNRNASRSYKVSHTRAIYGFGLGVMLLAAGLGWIGQQWLMVGVIALVGLVATIILVYISSQSFPYSPSPQHSFDTAYPNENVSHGFEHAVYAHTEALRQLLQPYFSSLKRNSHTAELVDIRKASQDVAEWQRQRKGLQETCRSLHEMVISAERRYRLLTAELGAAQKKEEERYRDWVAWLRQESLPEQLSPAGVKELVRRFEQAEEVEQQRLRSAEKRTRLLGQLELFEQDCSSLLHRAQLLISSRLQQENRTGSNEGGAVASLHAATSVRVEDEGLLSGSTIGGLFRLLERIEREQERELEYRQLTLHSNSLEEEWREQQAQALQTQGAMDKLLLEARVNTGYELLSSADAYNHKIELERLIRDLEAVLYRGGKRAAFQSMEELLIHYDGRELEQRITELTCELELVDERIRELEGRKGRLEQESERLKQEVEGASHHQEFALQEARLDEQASRYAVLALAKTLIQRTRKLYEEEKQPLVLKRAAHYMLQMTAGRYTRVLIPFGEKTITLERRDGQLVRSHHFSRGTAEQAYLSVRFALAEALAHRASVPFVLDDILVNFDRERAGLAIKALTELSRSHHVIMTTCHPHIARMIQHEPEAANVIELERLEYC